MQTAKKLDDVQPLTGVYAGEPITIRMLRAMGWGPELLNLGSFFWRGPLVFLNLIPDPLRLAGAQQRLVRQAAALLDLQRGDRVLDVACGRGRGSYYLAVAHPGLEVSAVDLLPENIAVARTLYAHTRGLSYGIGDAMNLDFPEASFDKVFCLEAAFHFPDRARFLAEAHRVLRPGGRLVVVDFMWRSRERTAILADKRTKLVQGIWGWQDFSAYDEYLEAASAQGFVLTGERDWSARVTRPLQWLSDVVVGLGKSAFGRRLLQGSNPLTRGISRGEWRQLAEATAAHRFVTDASRYVALVLERRA